MCCAGAGNSKGPVCRKQILVAETGLSSLIMKYAVIAAMTAVAAPTIATVLATCVAAADPAPPQQAAVCNKAANSSGALDNAQTFAPNGDVLICKPGAQVGLWQRINGIQRPVEVWFTYGPEATLAAGDVTPGQTWIGFNGSGPGTTCTAEQTSTSGGPPVVTTVNYDQMTDFHLLPNLATLKLKGSCSWRKA
jgi:hypothetical protein